MHGYPYILGPDGKYTCKYTLDLLTLDRPRRPQVPVDSHLVRTSSPLRLAMREQLLAQHPDREYADFITKGIELGVSIGTATPHERSSQLRIT